jgi:hypothetical protein
MVRSSSFSFHQVHGLCRAAIEDSRTEQGSCCAKGAPLRAMPRAKRAYHARLMQLSHDSTERRRLARTMLA